MTGNALGGGLQLALGADIRIVAPDASLSVLEVRWGLIPDMTGTQVLPRLVGLDVAKELAFTGRMVSGEEAVLLGLATRLSDACRSPMRPAPGSGRSRATAPHAVRGAKRLLNLAGPGLAREEAFHRRGRRPSPVLIASPNQVEAVNAGVESARPGSPTPRLTGPPRVVPYKWGLARCAPSTS